MEDGVLDRLDWRTAAVADAGDVGEHVGRTERGFGGARGLGDGRARRDVARKAARRTARFRNFRDRALRARGVAIDRRDACAFRREPQRRRAADATRRAGHHCDATFESPLHRLTPSRCVPLEREHPLGRAVRSVDSFGAAGLCWPPSLLSRASSCQPIARIPLGGFASEDGA